MHIQACHSIFQDSKKFKFKDIFQSNLHHLAPVSITKQISDLVRFTTTSQHYMPFARQVFSVNQCTIDNETRTTKRQNTEKCAK